jgi:hypothetical protein
MSNYGRTNAKDDEQQREHTGLRTLDAHFTAREVYRALHCPYPGTSILSEKAHLRAQASGERVRQSGGMPNSAGTTAAQDRSGESGASL